MKWRTPESKLAFSRTMKRRFPFVAKSEGFQTKCPKLDAAVAKKSKRSDLSLDYMGYLKNPLDRKMDALLKRSWESSAYTFFIPGVASTCVPRNLLS